MRLLEGLSETLRFSIFSSLFLLSLYFLSYNFLYHKVYSLFLSLHPKNKTLAHLPLSVGNHPRVVLHQLPSYYLGLPLGAAHNSVASWDGVEERFWKRLAMWKRQFISKGKRITLIRSTLSTIPIYFMSMLRMPRVVRLRLKKIQRDFLWGGRKLEKKSHLVKRSIVYSDETKGGLGVRCLSKLNKALLGKWSWCFVEENEAL